jgi:hypothetical protein
LGTDVAELRPDGEEEVILLSEWARIVLCDLDLLSAHVCVCDLWHWSEEEEYQQQTNEASDAQVSPLYILQPLAVVDGVCEEHSAGE